MCTVTCLFFCITICTLQVDVNKNRLYNSTYIRHLIQNPSRKETENQKGRKCNVNTKGEFSRLMRNDNPVARRPLGLLLSGADFRAYYFGRYYDDAGQAQSGEGMPATAGVLCGLAFGAARRDTGSRKGIPCPSRYSRVAREAELNNLPPEDKIPWGSYIR